jgi:hypothetical protein
MSRLESERWSIAATYTALTGIGRNPLIAIEPTREDHPK